MDRKLETKLVKQALIKAGYTGVTVGHGVGTSWGWLHIGVDTTIGFGVDYSKTMDAVERIAQRVTGRHGEWGGCINVTVHQKDTLSTMQEAYNVA